MDFLILTSAVRARLKHIGSICKGQEKSGRDFLIGAFTYLMFWKKSYNNY